MCHSRHRHPHHRYEARRPEPHEFAARRPAPHDGYEARRPAPLVDEPYDLRSSDAERERVVEALRTHAGDGRLDADELEERLERAYAARTRADLVPLLADLPPAGPAPRRTEAPRGGDGLRGFLMINALLIAIWAVTGAGYFWPLWPLIGTGFCLLAGGFQPRRHVRYQVTPH